jgi:hypothetical protein
MGALKTHWRQLWLPLAWIVGIVFVSQGLGDGFDPMRRMRGANSPGDFPLALGVITAEVAALYAILRPHSYRSSWGRATIALAVVFAAAAFGFLYSMHGGRVIVRLFFWQLALVPAISIAAGISGAFALSRVMREAVERESEA